LHIDLAEIDGGRIYDDDAAIGAAADATREIGFLDDEDLLEQDREFVGVVSPLSYRAELESVDERHLKGCADLLVCESSAVTLGFPPRCIVTS